MPVFALLFLIPATIVAVYYGFLTTLGWRRTRRSHALPPTTTFAIVIPAHDEEAVLASTLRAIQGSGPLPPCGGGLGWGVETASRMGTSPPPQPSPLKGEGVRSSEYPRELLSILVVADNCTDRTAEVAKEHGAACVERFDAVERGKGYALAFAIPQALAKEPDAILILDADCRLEPGALAALDAELNAGADAVQAAVTMGDPNAGAAGVVMAVGSEIENGVQAGLSRLGGTVRLRGTGMAFRRSVLERFPWQTFGLAEDAEYGAILRKAGIRVRFVPDAIVRNTPPTGVADLCKQRERWRAALFVGGASLFDRLTTSKPLILTQLAITVLVSAFASVEFFAWAVGLVGITGLVYFHAIIQAGVSPRAALGLWRTPAIVARLAWVTAGGLVSRGGAWVRTPRVA